MSVITEDIEVAYAAIRALVIKLGGEVVITEAEMNSVAVTETKIDSEGLHIRVAGKAVIQ